MHHTKQRCRFDSLLSQYGEKPLWDTILFQNANYAVAPTLGSILPGWLLVVSKRHHLNMSDAEDRRGLAEAHSAASKMLERSFGPVTTFEHGASKPGGLMGCGVDHAHVHVVSLPFSLSVAIKAYRGVSYEWECVPDFAAPVGCFPGRDYLYFREPGKPLEVAFPVRCPSQYFRRVIAAQLAKPDEFDYKRNPFVENAVRTVMQVGDQVVSI